MSPSKTAKLHGVLAGISPMKAGGKHFEGRLVDAAKSLRIVGFDSTIQF